MNVIAFVSYSHAPAVDPKHTASSTGQGKCKAPAVTIRATKKVCLAAGVHEGGSAITMVKNHAPWKAAPPRQ